MSIAGSAKKAIEKFGRTMRFIPNASLQFGLEAVLDGSEEGSVTLKVIFEKANRPWAPNGSIDDDRVGDPEGQDAMGWKGTIAADSLTSAPTINDRLVDADGVNYGISAPPVPTFYKDTPVLYELNLRRI